MNNILVISPHQDDFIIGCGGFLSKNKKSKKNVLCFYKIDNKKEIEKSAIVIGINEIKYLKVEARSFSVNKIVVNSMVRLIRQIKPSDIFIPSDDGDNDHKVCAELCLEAIFLAGNDSFNPELGDIWEIKNIYSYNIWSEIKKPPLLINIDKEIKNKIRAIRVHKSQLDTFPYDELIIARSRIYGLLKGCHYAEAFNIIKLTYGDKSSIY